jgi:hypothetical protein
MNNQLEELTKSLAQSVTRQRGVKKSGAAPISSWLARLGLVICTVLGFATQVHAQGGMPLWTNRFNGPGSSADYAEGLAVDNRGNVFVTGLSWHGNEYVGQFDYATVAYSSLGAPLWTNLYNGPGDGSDSGTALAVDGSGNVFVTGNSLGTNGYSDYATIKYSGDGVALWTNRYHGPGTGNDTAVALAVDVGGNVFVTGNSLGTNGYSDYATIKYSGGGVPLWTNRYQGPPDWEDHPSALAVDGNGNVFVTGYSQGSSSYYDYATVAYSATGVLLWTNRHHGPGYQDDQALALAVDTDGDVFVTGMSHSDYATIKYSGAGVPLWTNGYNGSGVATAIAVDGSGNVFVTGYSWGGGGAAYATIKYSGAGLPLWTNRYHGPVGPGNDYAKAVIVDGSGNAFVSGGSSGKGGPYDYDYATIAYSSAGVPLWTNRYNGPAPGGDDQAYSKCLAFGPDGSVYVTGSSDGGVTYYDYATIKYATSVPASIPLYYYVLGDDLVLNWTNSLFGLQSAPTVQGAYTNIPGATSPWTNNFPDRQRFFRLKAN